MSIRFMIKTLTIAEKILIAAAGLEKREIKPFSAEDLAVEAWKKYPDSFALEGYPEHPDSNRVYIEIMGNKPLRSRGWINKIGRKTYQLSEAGHLMVQSLGLGEITKKGSRTNLSREMKLLLGRLLTSRAIQKVKDNNLDAIIFPDACAFWDISPRSNAKTLLSRLESVEGVVSLAGKINHESSGLVFSHGGESISTDDINSLKSTHNFMLDKFAPELDVIRSRIDERQGF